MRVCTISNDSGPKSFNGTSAESLNDTSAENRVVGRCICSPNVGTKEHGESSNNSGSFSEDEVAQSKSEDVVVGQKRDLIDGDLEEFRIWE
jgi:hypothetical protein